MEANELSYVISHGLGPFVHNDLVHDVGQCVLCFDEQKNYQNTKQLGLLLKYWSTRKQSVVTRYFKSVFLGHVPAHILRDSIILFLVEKSLININFLLACLFVRSRGRAPPGSKKDFRLKIHIPALDGKKTFFADFRLFD